MNNSIYDLVKSHVCIFDTNLQNVKLPLESGETVKCIFQLDYLQWYPDMDRVELYWVPWDIDRIWIKDNPNWSITDYENVYIKTEIYWEHIAIDYQLVIPGKAPISLINRWYFKVREWKEYKWKWRITVYWKALKLYYMWYIQWLLDYIIKYNGVCCRADLCWDFPCNFPNWIIDLKITGTKYDTVYFGRDNSEIFFRKYNKTQDLKKDKNAFAWFYPTWYLKECWRLEAQITWRYSRSMTPLEWLEIMQVDKSEIQKLQSADRNCYKSLMYSAIDMVDWVNLSSQEKIIILNNSKNLLDKKIKKLMILPNSQD